MALMATESPSLRLSYARTLDRQLVHRRAVAEVFVTDSVEREQDDAFAFAAQWPARHGFFRIGGALDLLLVAETLRQITIATAHLYYGVPLNSRFVMAGLEVATSFVESSSIEVADLVVGVTVDGVRRRPAGVDALVAHHVFYRDDEPIASGRGDLTVLDARVYPRIRGEAISSLELSQPSTVPAAQRSLVGAEADDDIAIGARSVDGSWPLRIAARHSVYFDHPSDHVPGMLLFAAAIQAIRSATGDPTHSPLVMRGTFTRFLELDEEVRVSAQPRAEQPSEWDVTFSQREQPAAVVRCTLR